MRMFEQSICISVYLSGSIFKLYIYLPVCVCLTICLFIHLSTCICYLSVCLSSIYLSVYLNCRSICLHVRLSIYLSTCTYDVHMCKCTTVRTFVCLNVCMHACMDICMCVRMWNVGTGDLGYDGLNGSRKIGPSYAKSVVYI